MIDLLKQIPVTFYIAFLTALFTAVATLAGVFITNKANNQRLVLQLDHDREIKQKQLMREKLEELYLLFKEWHLNIEMIYINYTSSMKGDIDYKTLLDIEVERGNKNTLDFNRIEMLIDLYFPNIKPTYAMVIAARTKANYFMLVYGNQCQEGNTDGKKFVDPFLKAQDKFSQEAERVIKLIAEQANLV
jgi:hypothetical protein